MATAQGPIGTTGPAAAPQFMAPAPPGRVQMTLQQHYDAILALFRARPPRPDEIAATQQFFQQWQGMLSEEQQEPQGLQDEGAAEPQPPGGPASSLNGQEQPFGTSPGSQDLPGYGG